jgi:hypothetical protein
MIWIGKVVKKMIGGLFFGLVFFGLLHSLHDGFSIHFKSLPKEIASFLAMTD